MSIGDVVWLPNALILTALLAAVAVWRWRRCGALSGVRWSGVALLPLSLYAIGLYRLLWSVGLAATRFVTGFVFRPSVWLGVLGLAIAVACIMLPPRITGSRRSRPTSRAPANAPVKERDDMAEIEAILKKHGLG